MAENQSFLELQVDQTASKNLSEVARWARFLSITGFVCMSLMVIFFVSMQSRLAAAMSQIVPGFSDLNGIGVLLAIIIIAAAVGCLLLYFLFRGSTLIKRGIETKNQEVFNTGLASLKAYFTMYGILAIIVFITNLVSIF
jgi:hypothetical protein